MFGCLTFEMYLLGRQLIFTDQKPFLPLFYNPRKFGPARVERIRLRLQGFDCTVIYRPGETNPSDYRHPLVSDKLSYKEIEEQEGYLNMVIEDNVSEAISIELMRMKS